MKMNVYKGSRNLNAVSKSNGWQAKAQFSCIFVAKSEQDVLDQYDKEENPIVELLHENVIFIP